jgi:hypothetical protein
MPFPIALMPQRCLPLAVASRPSLLTQNALRVCPRLCHHHLAEIHSSPSTTHTRAATQPPPTANRTAADAVIETAFPLQILHTYNPNRVWPVTFFAVRCPEDVSAGYLCVGFFGPCLDSD